MGTSKIKNTFLRESTFIMPRGGDEDIKGEGTEIFSGIKGGGALKVLDILKGGGSKLFKVLVQQGPGVFTPTIVNRIDGLETR
jgi:hypothetical protein